MSATANKEYNTFIKGLVTEAGPLTFPEDSSLDERNMVLNRDGSRQRRLGMDYEEGFVLKGTTLPQNSVIAVHRWDHVNNDNTLQFVVVQTHQTLHVYDATAGSVSNAPIATVDLSSRISGTRNMDTESAYGYLIFTEGTTDPFYLEYTASTGAVTVHDIKIKIRDIIGLQSEVGDIVTPGSLSVNHGYNLRNQGWDADRIAAYNTAKNRYPSNAMQWWLGKDADDVFQPTLLDNQDFGNRRAPRGRFVIDAFNRSASRDTLTPGPTPVDIETGRPSVVGSAFGRIFYAGVQSSLPSIPGISPNYSGYVFFSRTIRNSNDFGMCYQEADPTSEHDAELVDTDGGYINIPNSGKIHAILQKAASLVVLAEKGVWEILGDDGGFRATLFQVRKITDFGASGTSSVVDAEDVMLYWNRGGIYLLAPEPQSGFLKSQNITENTIQTFYNNIPNSAKANASGIYDPVERKIRWLYNDTEAYDGVVNRNFYNKELVLDQVLGAFYPNEFSKIDGESPYVVGMYVSPEFVSATTTEIDGQGNPISTVTTRSRGFSTIKYVAAQYINRPSNVAVFTFASYKNSRFLDWQFSDFLGKSFDSYLITGYENMGDSMRRKQTPYILFHSKRTENQHVLRNGKLVFDNPSSCLVQAIWDYTTSPDSGKWGEPFQAYRFTRPFIAEEGVFNYPYEVITTRNRVRGKGRSLSLLIKSEPQKDLYLYGWATKWTGGSSV